MSTAANTIGVPADNAAGGGHTPLPVATNSVQVSLRVNVDVSGNVEIFTTTGQAVNNVVVCAAQVSAASLYDSSVNAVFEFWEPSTDLGTISGSVSRADQASATGQSSTSQLNRPTSLYTSLVTDLVSVLGDTMDASNAAPFNAYNGNDDYTTHDTFGDLALAAHAYYLFGHPAATAAISNDTALVNYFNGNTGNASTANIPNLLRSAIQALSDENATGIARQVISQDPSRASGQDNNELTPDLHQGLLFAENDVIYVSVTLQEPSITGQTIGGPATQMPGGAKFPTGGAQFTLRIVLSA